MVQLFQAVLIMRILLLLMIMSLMWNSTPSRQSSGVYYISNDGNDSNDGQTPETAWATVAKVNRSSFKPGSSILFEKGDTWRDRLKVPSSGTSGNPILISSYGTGDNPIFSSPILSLSWTDLGSGKYSASMGHVALLWEDSKQVSKATSSALSDGDWFQGGGSIYFRPSSGTPPDHELSYAHIYPLGNGIDVSDKAFITIDEIDFIDLAIGVVSYDKGVGTNSIQVENCNFIGCWRGMFMMPDINDNTDQVITNNYFKWCQNAITFYTTEALGTPEHAGHTHGTNIRPIISFNEMEGIGTIDGTILWQTRQTDYESLGFQNIIDSDIHDNYIHGGFNIPYTLFNLEGRVSSGNIFYRNRIEDTQKSIVFTGRDNFAAFDDNWIFYNVFKNSGDTQMMDFWQGNSPSEMNYFVNNTIYGENGKILVHSWKNPSVYLTIANNVFTEIGEYVFRCHDPVSDLVLSNNIYHQASLTIKPFFFEYDYKTLAQMQALGYEENSQMINPLLVSDIDFHLQSTSSAINAGVGFRLREDFERKLIVGLPDIGAFEYHP